MLLTSAGIESWRNSAFNRTVHAYDNPVIGDNFVTIQSKKLHYLGLRDRIRITYAFSMKTKHPTSLRTYSALWLLQESIADADNGNKSQDDLCRKEIRSHFRLSHQPS
jgi:hypothetical protein